VRTLLERLCGISRLTDPPERLALLGAEVAAHGLDPETLVPLLAPVLGIGAEHGYEAVPVEGRKLYELIGEAIRTYLLACFDSGAALLVAEDAHWFDPSTIEVLGSLLDAAVGRQLVVITGRPGGWLPDAWPVKAIDLKPLTDEQADALVTALNPAVTAEELATVRDRCDGVPFYIEQVVAGLGEQPTDAPGVPEGLYEPLFARLRATANVVPVLEAAATIGRHIDRGLLGAVVDLSEADIDDVIAELEDALVLEPWGTDGWRFRHELLREVAAELAPPSVRRSLHAKVADAVVSGVGGEPDWRLVATHYERAERFDEAASAYRQASTDARLRGALAEARAYLTQAITQLDKAATNTDRNRREIAARLERGFLTLAAEGYQSRAAAADFERCLQLGGTDLRDDELVATLVAVVVYYLSRADLRRAAQVLESLRAGLKQGMQWFRPAIEALFGTLAWLRGDFDAAATHLEQGTPGQAAAGQQQMDALWFLPDDPIALAYMHLALTRWVRGDLTGAEAELAHAARRTEQLSFPQGPYSLAYTRFVEIAMRAEAGQLDRAAVLAANLIQQAERHGFDNWRLAGANWQAFVEPGVLSAHIATLTTLLDTLRTVGLNIYIPLYDAILARVLIEAAQPEQARHRLDTGLQLAEDTGMHFYDAELLRLRAHTHTDPDVRQADIGAALELAHRQGATLFELRSALDDFELRGQPAHAALVDVVSRIPTNTAWPELARAQTALDS
jgi:hypothetical protein